MLTLIYVFSYLQGHTYLFFLIGRGGYGHVVLCKNKLDGRQYAVKKIRLKEKSLHDRILRSASLLGMN